MQIEVLATSEQAAARAAARIAETLERGVRERGRAAAALSGGRTPRRMLRVLASLPLAWSSIDLFQVDERIVPRDDIRRNLTAIEDAFAASGIPPENIHAMPVEAGEPGTEDYWATLCAGAGRPPVLDVVHLGLGGDGHTASLIPQNEVLEARDPVALSGEYQGTRRMTLTLPLLNGARRRVWLVTGAGKATVVARLLRKDPALVASAVARTEAFLVVDAAAAGSLAGRRVTASGKIRVSPGGDDSW